MVIFMKYIIRNLKSFIQGEKTIFMLVLLCIVTSSFIINFSYGLYQNYNVIKEEESSELTEMQININNSKLVTKDKLKQCVLSVSSKTNDNITMYYASSIVEPFNSPDVEEYGWGGIDIRFTVRENTIYPCELFKENLNKNGTLISGEYFTPEQETNGDLVAIARKIENTEQDCTTYLTTRIEGDDRWIEIQGKEYKVIGYHSQMIAPYIPFESLDETTELSKAIYIFFDKPLSRPDYNELKTSFEMTFADAITFPVLEIPESENYYLYNTIIIISIMIALLAAINFSVLYKYILSKRIKTLSVFRICGCIKGRILRIFLIECMLISIPTFAITTLLYDRIILPKLANHYEYIASAYSPLLYVIIFGIYTISSLIVLTIMIYFNFLKKTIRETKGGK